MDVAVLVIVSVFATCITAGTVTNETATTYDPAELLAKIFQPNSSIESRQRQGFIKFEEQPDPAIGPDNQDPGQYGLIDPERNQIPLIFEDNHHQNYNENRDNQHSPENRPLKFQDIGDDLISNNGVTFQDDNKVDDQGDKKKRKRRRRRKPKNGVFPYPGAPGLTQGIPGADSGRPEPEYQGPFHAGYGLHPYGNPGYPAAHPIRRPRRPKLKPSLATEALSSITGALTSIARYDDYQCVPRLLCEASGGGALSNNGVLQSIAGIQPLLTLLSAYNGISTSPLFVFGRAVFLGMTSKGNTGTCRYAYPQCPTDPEQLIYYLNNHNGGFFKFFNAPQLPNQNIEQFYNQLSHQGYGIYQPQLNLVQQSSGLLNDPNAGQSFGLYPNDPDQYQNLEQYYGQNYSLKRPGAYVRQSLYNNENYGSNYAYNYDNYGVKNQISFKDSNARIEKRIQNKPVQNLADPVIDNFENDDDRIKWQFPEDHSAEINTNNYNVRDSRTLKFPEEGQSYDDKKDSIRKGKQVQFPNNRYNQNYQISQPHVFANNNKDRYQTSTYSYNNGQNNQNYFTNSPIIYTNNNNYKQPTKYHNYNYNPTKNTNDYQNYNNNKQNIYSNNYKYHPNTVFNNEEYVFDHRYNFYVKKETNNYSNNGFSTNSFKRNEDDGLKTVYVVRGNGDPNKPEIVKLRPGQTVY